MSPVCSRCAREMRCTKTGRLVRFRIVPRHCYAGDEFSCSGCGAVVVVGLGAPFQADDKPDEGDITIDG